MSSRLAFDARGRMVVIQVTPAPELEVGQKFLVLGNGISTGRPADPGEYFFVGTKTDSLPMARTAIRPGRTAVHS